MSKYETYESSEDALRATNEFYEKQEGFAYSLDYVTKWLSANVVFPKKGRVLDLCCGDGIWSRGMQVVAPNLEYYGIDISSGGIAKAKTLMGRDAKNFVVGDTEQNLPFNDGFFDLIFARGPGLYNQHDMSAPSCVKVVEYWHNKLTPNGRFYSMFASKPDCMGTYTPMDEVVLPFNRAPRKTETLDFTGGKYHHSVESFHAPFWAGENVEVVKYSFLANLHILISRVK